MSEFKEGDLVTLKDTDHTSGWNGLRAVVVRVNSMGNPEIRMDCGDVRPDGHTHEPFVWRDLELREPPEPEAVVKLKAALTEAQQQRNEAVMELEAFKEKVVRVAGKYAVRHDWCSVVTEALAEMDLPTTVTKTVRISGSVSMDLPICGDDNIDVAIEINGEAVDTYHFDVDVEVDDE